MGSKTTFWERLAALGFSAYSDYLDSAGWWETRTRLIGKACFCCAAGRGLQLHHRTYVRLGREAADDMVTLCRGCHVEVHRAEKLMGKKLAVAHYFVRQQVAGTPPRPKTPRKNRKRCVKCPVAGCPNRTRKGKPLCRPCIRRFGPSGPPVSQIVPVPPYATKKQWRSAKEKKRRLKNVANVEKGLRLRAARKAAETAGPAIPKQAAVKPKAIHKKCMNCNRFAPARESYCGVCKRLPPEQFARVVEEDCKAGWAHIMKKVGAGRAAEAKTAPASDRTPKAAGPGICLKTLMRQKSQERS